MAFLIMQDDQRATSQDFSCPPDQSAWDQCICIDGLAVTIDVKDRCRTLFPLGLWLPQSSRPTCKRFREGDICSNAGQLCQESLSVAVAVGPMPTGEQGKSLASVAT